MNKQMWKVLICSGMIMALLVFSAVCPVPVTAASQEAPIEIFLNGKALVMDVPPVQLEGRTLVPFRAIGEALKAEVSWDGSANLVTLTLGDKTVKLTIGNKTAYVNGKAITLDVPAMLIEGRTMVPLRFIGESLGATVQWLGELRRIEITTAEPSAAEHFGQVMVDISVNSEGQVLPELQRTAGEDQYYYFLKLLAEPDPDAATVWNVPDYVGMRVIGGPVEEKGITWWKLEGHGKTGWADERCFTEIDGEWNPQLEAAIAWAIENIGNPEYSFRCLRFVQDAYREGGIKLAGMPWGHAKNAATIFNAAANKDKPVPRGAAVFYDWEGTVGEITQNWGHVGIALTSGKYDEILVINALDYVYVDSGAMLAHGMDMDYIGWAWVFDNK